MGFLGKTPQAPAEQPEQLPKKILKTAERSKSGRVEEWKSGRMEGRKSGRVETRGREEGEERIGEFSR